MGGISFVACIYIILDYSIFIDLFGNYSMLLDSADSVNFKCS